MKSIIPREVAISEQNSQLFEVIVKVSKRKEKIVSARKHAFKRNLKISKKIIINLSFSIFLKINIFQKNKTRFFKY